MLEKLGDRFIRRPAGRLAERLQRRARPLARRLKRARVRIVLALAAVVALALAAASSCRTPPENPQDLCAVFGEKRSWYRAAKRSAKEWGVPEAVQMAILRQESGFRARVRPPRGRFLWIFPGPRPSSAYGYGQVIEATWRSYRESTGRAGARRDDFADVTHFVGWYCDRIHHATGIPKDDASLLYLAYHEGPRGYLEGRHRSKPLLLETARRVGTVARRYQTQYDGCRKRLDRWWIFW